MKASVGNLIVQTTPAPDRNDILVAAFPPPPSYPSPLPISKSERDDWRFSGKTRGLPTTPISIGLFHRQNKSSPATLVCNRLLLLVLSNFGCWLGFVPSFPQLNYQFFSINPTGLGIYPYRILQSSCRAEKPFASQLSSFETKKQRQSY